MGLIRRAHGLRDTAYRPELDGLRAVAVGLVILGHADAPFGENGGIVGVTAFFVLSGYLITGLLLAEQERTGRIDLRAFYGRRVRRLGPALLVLLVFVLLIDLLGRWPGWPLSIFSSLFYVSNWVQSTGTSVGLLGHTWSLSIEEQFYLIWPGFLILVGIRRASLVAIALISIFVAVRLPATGPVEYFSTFTRGDAILVGCLLAVARPRMPAWAGAAGIAVMLVLAVTDLSHDVSIPIAILASGAIVTSSWTPLGRLAPMGKRAYGLYLWNWPLAVLLGGMAAVPMTFVAAETSWRLVEVKVRPVVRRSKETTRLSEISIGPSYRSDPTLRE